MITHVLKLFSFAIVLFPLVVQAASEEPQNVWENYEKIMHSLPEDASKILDQAVICRHLAGEINGDGSQEDKDTIREINLHCGEAGKNIRSIKIKYKNNIAVQNAIKTYYENE